MFCTYIAIYERTRRTAWHKLCKSNALSAFLFIEKQSALRYSIYRVHTIETRAECFYARRTMC